MSSHIMNISFGAHDPYAQTVWWDQILEDFHQADGVDQPGDDECGLDGPDDQAVLFLRVPESKTVKNRVYLCLVAAAGDRDGEIDRIQRIGDRRRRPPDPRRQGLGGIRRSRGQRVLRRPQPRRGRGRPRMIRSRPPTGAAVCSGRVRIEPS